MKLKEKWLRLSSYGALWLTLATFTTKLIGVLQKIPLQNLAGDAVFGIYNIVYPIYQLMMALAIAGIPTALSYYVAKQQPTEQRQTLYVGLIVTSIVAAICSLLGLLGAPWIASFIGHVEVEASIAVLAIALLFTPLLAVYRGYYQGIHDAKSSSISQLIEQCVRVTCMVLFLVAGIAYQWSDENLAAGVMWGSAIGAVVTLLWFVYKQKGQAQTTRLTVAVTLHEGKQLARIALPTALAAIVVPMVSVVDALSIPRLLLHAGEHTQTVMAEYGQYSRIQPLIQLVSMLLGAFVAGFIPSWMQQQQQQQPPEWLGTRLMLLHRISCIIGIAASVGLFVLAEPINIMLYKDAAGITAFRILSLTTLSSSMLAVQAPLLQAAGIRRLPIYLLLIAAGSKAILNIWLVPIWGMEGAAAAAVIALFIPAIIGYFTLLATQSSSVKSIVEAIRVSGVTLLALLLMVSSIQMIRELVRYMWPNEWHTRLANSAESMLAVLVGAIVFGGILYICKGIKKGELALLRNNTK